VRPLTCHYQATDTGHHVAESNISKTNMPAHVIKFKHSKMPADYIGSAIKYANTRNDAISLLGKHDKKLGTVLDKRGCILTLID
jgi:hypothetical protein